MNRRRTPLGFNLAIFVLAATVSTVSRTQQTSESKKDVPTITREAIKAVVLVVASDASGKEVRQGSGFLVSANGKVVTNYHVIEDMSSAVIKFPNGAFYEINGLLAADKKRDLAVLKADGKGFPFVPLGDSDRVEVGEEVLAIGSPLALEATVSNGIISGIREMKEESITAFQTTAPISPGSSGGALFNLRGEVIGITTFQFSRGQNLNFAIPINYVKPLLLTDTPVPLDDLRFSLTGSYTGEVRNATAGISAKFGITIREEQGTIYGCMVVQRPLYGSGSLRGTSYDSQITFSVGSPVFLIKFVGNSRGDGLQGTYAVLSPSEQHGTFILQKESSKAPPPGFDPAECRTD